MCDINLFIISHPASSYCRFFLYSWVHLVAQMSWSTTCAQQMRCRVSGSSPVHKPAVPRWEGGGGEHTAGSLHYVRWQKPRWQISDLPRGSNVGMSSSHGGYLNTPVWLGNLTINTQVAFCKFKKKYIYKLVLISMRFNVNFINPIK